MSSDTSKENASVVDSSLTDLKQQDITNSDDPESQVCNESVMDRISELTDELLVKIMSLLPTKIAVSTSILSKRWECLWMWLPKLEFICDCRSDLPVQGKSLSCFLNRSLPLHRAPVIESFRLDIAYASCKTEDVRLWISIAVSRHLRELDISYYPVYLKEKKMIPSSLYVCKSLAVLKLKGSFFLKVPPRTHKVLLPCMKSLQLKKVTDFDEESLQRLLSICPVLENLSVEFDVSKDLGKIIVTVMSLQSLSISIPFLFDCEHDGLEINTPSLKYLELEDLNIQNPPCLIENMPELEEAYVNGRFPNFGAITSVKRLTIGSKSEAKYMYGNGFVFNKLEHLKLDKQAGSSNLLASLLINSPNLRELDINCLTEDENSDMSHWNQLLTARACYVSSLQTLKWSSYFGRPEETAVAVYILKNACLLKTATFISDDWYVPKPEILMELSLIKPASTTCQLFFN